MKTVEKKRLSVGAIIKDKKSLEEYKITAVNKRCVTYTGIRGLKVSGGIPKGAFHDNFRILKEGWTR